MMRTCCWPVLFLVLLGGCTPPAAELPPTLPASAPPPARYSVLDRVQQRGVLWCGVAPMPGFATQNADGTWSGFTVDLCRAIAAALFGEAAPHEIRNVTADRRFTALQTGDVDVLLHPLAPTLSRDAENAIDFVPPFWLNGLGLMARAPLSPAPRPTLAALNGQNLCVDASVDGPRLQQALADRNLTVVLETDPTPPARYQRGDCRAIAADQSQLLAWRRRFPDPAQHVLLPELWSLEPYTAAVVADDSRWRDAVSWIFYALLRAEELGLTAANIRTPAARSEIAQFVGTEGALGIALGLGPDWAVQAVQAVGNYQELYRRHLEPLGWPRTVNRLWQQGGLFYSPPFR
ncbi:MAG: transporter substrate-binding domain-containing protein [Oscillatoriales cyanobacterium SM2_1_8]|nr:transporter substrate-binding domain-containing protein [Oscillatoriales cyanobacterium SM2_1_8]